MRTARWFAILPMTRERTISSGASLARYEDGRVEMDSNLVENQIRPVTLNRKNALFAGHDEGAQSWARIASLIGTCKLGGVEPYAYLKATLGAIARGHPQSRLDDLLPWNFDHDGNRTAAVSN